jgi:hypothetical protein
MPALPAFAIKRSMFTGAERSHHGSAPAEPDLLGEVRLAGIEPGC